MRKPIRVALVGFSYGHQMDYGRQLADHPLTELVAVCHPDDGSDDAIALAREFAEQRGVPFVDNADDVIRTHRPEAISIALPPEINTDYVTACAEAGIHVMCEKPIGATAQTVDDMAAVVRASGITFTCAIPAVVYSNAFRPAMEQLEQGAIGEPRTAHFQFLQPRGPQYTLSPEACRQRGRAELANFGPYGILALRKVFKQPIRSIFARKRAAFYEHYREHGVEDIALLSVAFQGGGVGTILVGRTTTQSQPTTDCRMQVVGSQGVLNIENGLGYGLDLFRDEYRRVNFGPSVGQLYADDFVQAICHQASPGISLDEAVDVFHALENAFASAEAGQVIER